MARRRRGRFEAGWSESAALGASIALADVKDGSVLPDDVRAVEKAVEITCNEPITDVVEDGSRAESVNLENCTETEVR